MHTRIESDWASLQENNLLKAGKITLIVLVIWLVVEFAQFGLLFLNLISIEAIVLQQCVWNFLSSAVVGIGLIIVQVKYSGLPFKSEQAGKYLKTVLFVTFV